MKYEHPTIQCESPAPGHFLISGHAPRPVLLAAGYLVPPGTVHISPELPSAVLRAILEERGDGASGPNGEGRDAESRQDRTPTSEPEGGERGTGFQPVAVGSRGRSSKTADLPETPPARKGLRRTKDATASPQSAKGAPRAHSKRTATSAPSHEQEAR